MRWGRVVGMAGGPNPVGGEQEQAEQQNTRRSTGAEQSGDTKAPPPHCPPAHPTLFDSTAGRKEPCGEDACVVGVYMACI